MPTGRPVPAAGCARPRRRSRRHHSLPTMPARDGTTRTSANLWRTPVPGCADHRPGTTRLTTPMSPHLTPYRAATALHPASAASLRSGGFPEWRRIFRRDPDGARGGGAHGVHPRGGPPSVGSGAGRLRSGAMAGAPGTDGRFEAGVGTWVAGLGEARDAVRQHLVQRQLAVHLAGRPTPLAVLDVGCRQGTQTGREPRQAGNPDRQGTQTGREPRQAGNPGRQGTQATAFARAGHVVRDPDTGTLASSVP